MNAKLKERQKVIMVLVVSLERAIAKRMLLEINVKNVKLDMKHGLTAINVLLTIIGMVKTNVWVSSSVL